MYQGLGQMLTMCLQHHQGCSETPKCAYVIYGQPLKAINTHRSVLTVEVVGAGVAHSWCQKAGERWLGILGTLAGEHLDSVDRKAVHLPSSNHELVLKFNTTSQAESMNK